MAEQTKKRSMTTDDEIWEVRSKNTPTITAYRHRCCKRQQIFGIIALRLRELPGHDYSMWLTLGNNHGHALKNKTAVTICWKQEINSSTTQHLTSSIATVIITTATRRLCHFNVSRCCFGAFTETTDAVVLLDKQPQIKGLYTTHCVHTNYTLSCNKYMK